MALMNVIQNGRPSFENVGPWKYVVLLAIVVIMSSGVFHYTSFGIVYGKLLAEIGSEAQDTSTVNSIFTTVALFSGLPTQYLLSKISHRNTAYIGAILLCVGSLLSTFATSTTELVIYVGILQGAGVGLLLIVSYGLFEEYFNERRSFYMNFANFITSIIAIAFPSLTLISNSNYGLRGTILLKTAVTLNVIAAVLCLQPVKWHIRCKQQSHELFEIAPHDLVKLKKPSNTGEPSDLSDNKESNGLSVSSGFKRCCLSVSEKFDLSLFKDPSFINVVIGVSLVRSTEFMYVSFLPLLLTNAGFSSNNMSLVMSIYILSDFVGKACLCALTAFVKVNNRYLFLISAYSAAIFQLGQIYSYNFLWIACSCAIMGFSRPLMANPAILLFAEMYPQKFVSSLSLSMVVNSILMLVLGQIIRIFTSITDNKNIILVILSAEATLCAITWTIELSYKYLKKRMLNK